MRSSSFTSTVLVDVPALTSFSPYAGVGSSSSHVPLWMWAGCLGATGVADLL